MKKELMEFILAIIDKTYKLLKKMKCYFCCCNSSCAIDNSKTVIKKSKSESSLDEK